MVNMAQKFGAYQWGKETTRGTAVAATSKMLNRFDPEELDEHETPDLALGIGFMSVGNEFATVRGTKISIPDFPLNYEQAMTLIGLMGVKGGVTPTGVDPYTWTFTPSLTTDPALESRTFERRLTDGVNNIDHEWAYVMLESWAIKWGQAGFVSLSAEGFGRRRQNSTLTPALTAPIPTHIPARLMTYFIDSAWGSLGGTAVTGQILGGELKYETGVKNYAASDGRTDLDFSSYEFDPTARKYSLKYDLLVRNAAQYATELAAAEALTKRAVRIRATNGARILTFDGLFVHARDSLTKTKVIDGQDAVEVELVQTTDGTNSCSLVIVNAQANSN